MAASSFIKHQRLDLVLTERGLAQSRSRARDMINRGCVTVDGHIATKAGQAVAHDAEIAIEDAASAYVSRAALKLIAGLEISNIEVGGHHTVDLGASTGGFTQVLLERGAASVTAIDVGHGQLVQSIADDPRVINLENQNARALEAHHFAQRPSIVVSDMSFVSLILAAEPALKLAAPSAKAILLVKPQFEVGKDGIGKGGIVASPELAQKAVDRVAMWFNDLPGWAVTSISPSPILGGDGNKEFLLCGERNA